MYMLFELGVTLHIGTSLHKSSVNCLAPTLRLVQPTFMMFCRILEIQNPEQMALGQRWWHPPEAVVTQL